MKKLQFILVTLFFILVTNNTFSQTMTFVVTTTEGESDDYNKKIALYKDVDLEKNGDIMTLIKPNGEVIKNFDTSTYYENATSQEEVIELTSNIVGSELAIVTIDVDNNQLTLSIGDVVNDTKEILKTTAMSLCDLDFKRNAAIFDMEKKLAIYCVKK